MTDTGRSSKQSTVEQMIIQSNPILEAFGNAQTVRNYNSSRFGKYIELVLSPQGAVVVARITEYLLEKSRIVQQDAGERNFHVFYQLVRCATQEERERWGLDEYVYQRGGGTETGGKGTEVDYNITRETTDRWSHAMDQREHDSVLNAMKFLGFSEDERYTSSLSPSFRLIALGMGLVSISYFHCGLLHPTGVNCSLELLIDSRRRSKGERKERTEGRD